MSLFAYQNGEIVSRVDATVSANHLVLQRGYGVFDFFAYHNGKFFKALVHLKRLRASAKFLNLEVPLPDEKILEISEELIKKSNLLNPAIRIFITGGVSLNSKPNINILAEECPFESNETYLKGVSLVSTEFQRELPEVKTINYINSVRLVPLIKEMGAYDVLYHKNNLITECPRANIFAFKGDSLLTPKENILFGVTRKSVIDFSQNHFEVNEQDISLNELYEMDEIFITSTSKKVLPVVMLNKRKIGDGEVGKRVKKVMETFEQMIR